MSTTPEQTQAKPKRNKYAMASVIFGVTGMLMVFISGTNQLPFFAVLALLTGILAIVIGVLGMRRAKEMEGKGRLWGIGGIVIGAADLLFSLLVLLSS